MRSQYSLQCAIQLDQGCAKICRARIVASPPRFFVPIALAPLGICAIACSQHFLQKLALVHGRTAYRYACPKPFPVESNVFSFVYQVATLRSAVKLEQEQQFLIAKKLQELTGSKNIKLKPVVDKSLIAGFVVEYGSSQIDMSVKGQLDKIGTELESAAGVV